MNLLCTCTDYFQTILNKDTRGFPQIDVVSELEAQSRENSSPITP
jgi:hypothetical protein